MKKGQHQVRWQFNCFTHLYTKPVRFHLDNGDYDTNFVIDSMEVIFCRADKTTNNTSISNKTHQVVLSLTENGAIPQVAAGGANVNFSNYSMRVTDRRQIAWAQMDDEVHHVILDPHNIVGQDLWLNAWAYDSAHEPTLLDQDIGVLITMSSTKQSGSRALLQSVRDEPLR
jgi:hypothetical protein